MNLQELQKELKKIQDKGYIPSLRRGSTGIGHTIESELGLKESNVAIPDLGGRVELKSTRRSSTSLITLYTFNRGVWRIPQKIVIEEYGYKDKNGRLALYSTVKAGKINNQGLTLIIDDDNSEVHLIHDLSKTLIATWSIFTIVAKFLTKTERLLFILADSRKIPNHREEFHFNEAYLLTNPKPREFLKTFRLGKIVIDIRMHLKPNIIVRSHGTSLRMREIDLPFLYSNSRRIL